MKRFAYLLLVTVALCSIALADNVLISGNAVTTNENDQWVNMLFGSPVTERFQNQGTVPVPTTRDCVVGQQCQIFQTIAGVFNVPRSSAGNYSYDFAYIVMNFDMVTTDLVQSVTGGDPNGYVSTTGTFTGLIELFDCAPGADCPYYGEVQLNSLCPTGDCPPTFLETYSLSGIAAGDTDTWNPRANADFTFSGTAALVPEPSCLIMLGSGLTAIALRKKPALP